MARGRSTAGKATLEELPGERPEEAFARYWRFMAAVGRSPCCATRNSSQSLSFFVGCLDRDHDAAERGSLGLAPQATAGAAAGYALDHTRNIHFHLPRAFTRRHQAGLSGRRLQLPAYHATDGG